MYCIKCNGTMIGDGYTSVLRCEHADVGDVEPDSNPVYCDFAECSKMSKPVISRPYSVDKSGCVTLL